MVFKYVKKGLNKVKRSIRKTRRNVGQGLTNRYYKKGQGLKIQNVAKDVYMLKKLMNVEKKHITISASNNIGQFANLLNSYNILDITPQPAENVTYNGRTGSSIKCVSYHMDMQFIHLGSTTQPIKGKVYIIQNLGMPLTAIADQQSFFLSLFIPNPFITGYGGTVGATGIVEYNSSFNPDMYGRYKIIQSETFTVPADQFTGQPMYKTIKFGHKYEHHVRFNKDATSITNGQLFMITLLDSGNAGGVTSTLTGVPVQTSSTGVTQNMNLVHYYVDN